MTWQKASAAKGNDLWRDVPRDWRVQVTEDIKSNTLHEYLATATDSSERQILELTPSDLLQALARGDVSSREVLVAFAHRAILAHQHTTCLSENNMSAAMKQSNVLDAHWRSHRSATGHFHGLPVSMMDRFHVAGLDSACGFASWVGTKLTSQEEGSLVRLLRALGAVVHCKTNVPMSMMIGETCNNIIGTTTNPYNRSLSAGGACGGEGALIALGGSPLGFGTDVAGSCRIPSAFCGLWALKCSEHRLPSDGIATILQGLPVVSGAIGLLSQHRAILGESLKALVDSRLTMADTEQLPLPWRQEALDAIRRRSGTPGETNGRLVFAVMASDGHVRPHPPVQRAIKMVTTALMQSGHEVVVWDPPPHSPAVETLFKILGSTSAIKARLALDKTGEPPVPQLAEWYRETNDDQIPVGDFWDLCSQLTAYRAKYKAYWHQTGGRTKSGRIPDGVILPVAPTLAVRPGEFHYYGYSAIANVLDYPSGVFPVTKGDRKADTMPVGLEPLNELDGEVQSTFHINDIQGLPAGLQVMCPRLEEETVVGLMDAIAQSLATTRENSGQT